MSSLTSTFVRQVLELGLNYLKKQQQSDGSFLSLSSPDPNNFTRAIQFQSVFSTTLILQNVSFLPQNSSVTAIKKAAAKFLLTQKSPHWSWNYWVRESKAAKNLPYPDDLDDTFCALSGLFLADETVITGEVLAYASQLLTALEVAEGGPYRTWLTTNDADPIWRDVDLGVNSNVAYFLTLQGITLPKLTNFFHQALQSQKIQSPYYPVRLPLLYFLSRLIRSSTYKKILTTLILTDLAKTSKPLEISLGVLGLLNLKYPVKKLTSFVNQLTTAQAKNGSWPAATFYTGVNPTGKRTFSAGSTALTTSYCLAALGRFERVNRPVVKSMTLTRKAAIIQIAIIKQVEDRFAKLGTTLRPIAQAVMQKIVTRDKDKQIMLLPFFFREALGAKGKKIPDALVVQLAAASIYGWIAYTIYDDFLDEEGMPIALSLANVCLRELTQIFTTSLPQNSAFQTIFPDILDQLDEANTWEVANCRFIIDTKIGQITIPDYGHYEPLAQRSLGHALGSIALILSLEKIPESSAIKNLQTFYHHFLIARQLNDDAHDWAKDLRRGQINSVGALILTQAQSKYSTATVSEVISELQQVFWHKSIDTVCNDIETHVAAAKKSLAKISLITDSSFLIRLVNKQLAAAVMARQEKSRALEFMRVYDVQLE